MSEIITNHEAQMAWFSHDYRTAKLNAHETRAAHLFLCEDCIESTKAMLKSPTLLLKMSHHSGLVMLDALWEYRKTLLDALEKDAKDQEGEDDDGR